LITYKLPYKTDNPEDIETINQYQKVYSKVLRLVFNRKKDGLSDKEVRSYMKTLSFSVNCWVIESALYESKALISSNENESVIFGSKKQFIRCCKGLISNEEFKKSRISKFYSVGQANQFGNRFFGLNIIDDNQIIFKPNRDIKIKLNLPKLKPNIKKDLFKLELLTKSKEMPFTIKLDSKYIYIMFEEFKTEDLIVDRKERFMSLDLNPNHIGVSICEYLKNPLTGNPEKGIVNGNHLKCNLEKGNVNDNPLNESLNCDHLKGSSYKVLLTQEFDLTELVKSSSHNKIKFETLEISKTIMNIFNHYKCKYLFLEDLNMVSKNHNKGKENNKLLNNSWVRNLLSNNLNKKCNILGVKCYKINAAYSSYIGNLQHDYSDPINASIEIGRRGYEVIILKNKDSFYPSLNIKDSLLHQWKETDIDRYLGSWKELCLYIKNSKLRYRVPMGDVHKHHKVYRQKYNNPNGLFTYICK
jgi:hypothetical protein